MKKPHWQIGEFKRAQDLMARGHTVASAANIIGRPVHQLREKIRWENMPPAKRDEVRERTKERRRAKNEGRELKSIRKNQVYVNHYRDPSEDLLEEARQRLLAPRTITQEFFGDPVPGFSALDRKLRGEEEPFCFDHRAAQVRSRITLPGQS